MPDKKVDAILREYVGSLGDKELQKLGIMFKQNLCGDKRRICEFLSVNEEVDQWLATSADCEDLYAMVATIGEYVREEYRRRMGQEDERRGRDRERDGDKDSRNGRREYAR